MSFRRSTPRTQPRCRNPWRCLARPPFVLPTGDSKARGAKGLKGFGTVKLADGKLQVTYHKEPLYTFADDTGHSVKGNGVGPFEVVPAP